MHWGLILAASALRLAVDSDLDGGIPGFTVKFSALHNVHLC